VKDVTGRATRGFLNGGGVGTEKKYINVVGVGTKFCRVLGKRGKAERVDIKIVLGLLIGGQTKRGCRRNTLKRTNSFSGYGFKWKKGGEKAPGGRVPVKRWAGLQLKGGVNIGENSMAPNKQIWQLDTLGKGWVRTK